MICVCGYEHRRTEEKRPSGNRITTFTCTSCNRIETELRSRNGALIRWRHFVAKPTGDGNGESENFFGMDIARLGDDRSVVYEQDTHAGAITIIE